MSPLPSINPTTPYTPPNYPRLHTPVAHTSSTGGGNYRSYSTHPFQKQPHSSGATTLIAPALAAASFTALALADTQSTQQPVSNPQHTKQKSTFGIKVFEGVLYPLLANTAVFAISVGFTYLTKHGKEGGFFRSRGEETVKWFEGANSIKLGNPFKNNETLLGLKNIFKDKNHLLEFKTPVKLSPESADMAKMILYSFVDGSAVAVLVALAENYSIPISKWIDKKAGTQPPDDSPYEAHAKHPQTLSTIALGRLATAGIVIPTAVALDKTRFKALGNRSLNDVLFHTPGEKLGEYVNTHVPQFKESIAKIWPKDLPPLDLPYLGKTVLFEAFYTSVCTLGLYGSSRVLAGPVADFLKQFKHPHQPVQAKPASSTAPSLASTTTQPVLQYA
jgi:hypothetical protein